jgi:hypothetical protein
MFGLTWRAGFLAGAVSAGAVSSMLLLAIAAGAADLYTKAPRVPGCVQAVDGLNGKANGYGGTLNDKTLDGGQGSFGVPLGCEYGLQVDGLAGSFNDNSIFAIGGHLFWRNPSSGLYGLYGSFLHWNQFTSVDVNHIGPEAEWYLGRWTVQGVAGAEFGNAASGQVGPNILTYDIRTRFFDQVNLAYYLGDNLKVFLGHRFLGGKNALAIGGEWGIPLGFGRMGSLFVEGRVGEANTSGVWGGMRFYFGQKDKPLIRRHREDDPVDWNNGGVSNPGVSTPAPMPAPQSCCPTVGSLELAPGMKLVENLATSMESTCCSRTMLDLTPGTQLAENAVIVARPATCGCPV